MKTSAEPMPAKGTTESTTTKVTEGVSTPPPATEPKKTEGGTVKIGILHSLTGTMAISEISLRTPYADGSG